MEKPPGRTDIYIKFAVEQCEIWNRIRFKINKINDQQTPKNHCDWFEAMAPLFEIMSYR